jgi:hypothetical protein
MKCKPPDPSPASTTIDRPSNVVVVDFVGRPSPDLRDKDNVHRNVKSDKLVDVFSQLADLASDEEDSLGCSGQ